MTFSGHTACMVSHAPIEPLDDFLFSVDEDGYFYLVPAELKSLALREGAERWTNKHI